MKTISFEHIKLKDGFWKEKQDLISETTVRAVYDRFKETGRIATMSCKALGIEPHIFWGSDVFKWIEGAAYLLQREDRPDLVKKIQSIIDDVAAGMTEDGYYNSYFNTTRLPRFSDRDKHELYSLGHMIEAGIAYYHATGEDRLLRLSQQNADLVYQIFVEQDSAAFVTPGHEEIELALIRLYRETKIKKYLTLAKFFIDHRGANEKDKETGNRMLSIDNYAYCQSHLPVKEQSEVKGHAVRALYLFCAVADLAEETGDDGYFAAADSIFDSIYNEKMYITGGSGASGNNESFSAPFDLPNYQAYSETCAALSLALFGGRMSNLCPDGKYGDAVERAVYNGMLSGLSLTGDAFFYVNPLEIDLSKRNVSRLYLPKYVRQKVFKCSCCPPNLVRFIPSIGNLIYGYDEAYLYVHQYIANQMEFDGIRAEIDTAYPCDGTVKVRSNGKKLALRLPLWCEHFTADAGFVEKNGYLYFDTDHVTITFDMTPKFVVSASAVHDNAGKVALMRGPIVYCLESKDQPADVFCLRVDADAGITESGEMYGSLPCLTAHGEQMSESKALYSSYNNSSTPCKLHYIPYYTFANRGEDNMQVWVLRK